MEERNGTRSFLLIKIFFSVTLILLHQHVSRLPTHFLLLRDLKVRSFVRSFVSWIIRCVCVCV